jgi:hypothetical protein
MKANAQLRGGARSGCYSTRFDPAFGWCADESRHTILRLNEDNDRDAFCNHAINHDKNLCYPIGVDTNGSATTVKLSIAGSIKSYRVDCNLVDAIVSQPLPVLCLPHLANQKLAGILELDLWLLASRIEALAGMHPISRSHSFLRLPEGEWLSYCYRKLRNRLSFFPPNYEFFINRTVRDLMGFCWGVSRLADVSETRSDLLTHLFIRLFKCCCHAILLSVESLVWHGYGFLCQDHEAVMKLVRVLRSQPQITKREILRKAQWLNSDNRDKLLDTLASEGLIEISERQVRALRFDEFVAEIPKRSVPDPVFTCARPKPQPKHTNE